MIPTGAQDHVSRPIHRRHHEHSSHQDDVMIAGVRSDVMIDHRAIDATMAGDKQN